ncbi:hypothetical protein OIU91_05795 [Streptomyces sp. NBC_01456]|uniref:hypothetical protein n=1 Tax=unclassified Streptomyces TaxID=2593676 RepID=UPI002E2F355C|nr:MULTISPECIES: hypothetical protein [unclassified Streptomyces]
MTTTIEGAVAVAMDAIGDDPDYAAARDALAEASTALVSGTTAEVQWYLERALHLIDDTCPI